MKNRTHERLVFATKVALSALASVFLFIAGLAVITAVTDDPYNRAAAGLVWLAAAFLPLAFGVDAARRQHPTTTRHRRTR